MNYGFEFASSAPLLLCGKKKFNAKSAELMQKPQRNLYFVLHIFTLLLILLYNEYHERSAECC